MYSDISYIYIGSLHLQKNTKMKIANHGNNDEQDNEHVRCSSTSFSGIEKQALYKAIFSRRDVRSHFIEGKNVPNDVIWRILDAAHHAPSVGFSQPWNFI